jgi:hypothetical protein
MQNSNNFDATALTVNNRQIRHPLINEVAIVSTEKIRLKQETRRFFNCNSVEDVPNIEVDCDSVNKVDPQLVDWRKGHLNRPQIARLATCQVANQVLSATTEEILRGVEFQLFR